MNQTLIEACVDSVESAMEAFRGGADRVELCSALSEGGLTPSIGTIKLARQNIPAGLHVLIRPRRGDFLYSDPEFRVMLNDIEQCKNLNVNGIVTGILLRNGGIDKLRMMEIVKISRPMTITFHRAFDMCNDPFTAIDELYKIGIDRILTSGLMQKAIDGADNLKKFVEYSSGRIIIMPGSGVRVENIKQLKNETGASEFHVSGKEIFESEMSFRNQNLSMSNMTILSEYQTERTISRKISEIVKEANQ